MALEECELSGAGWWMNYFRPAPRLQESESDIESLRMPDGLAAGAHLGDDDGAGWLPVTVPCDVRTGLVAHGMMEDPYWARNSDRSRWVEQFEWWFRREVEIPESWSDHEIILAFRGVDYLADYYWDGHHLGDSNDMFVVQRFKLSSAMSRPGRHMLAVRLSPPVPSTPNHFRNGHIPARSTQHKMQCAWGWDWARGLVGIGIWDSVHLEAVGPTRIDDVFITGKPEMDGGAVVQGRVVVQGQPDSAATIELDIQDPNDRRIYRCSRSIEIGPMGRGTCIFEHRIDQPALWWPNGYGEQPLYHAEVRVRVGGKAHDIDRSRFGIRHIEMLPNPGAPDEAHALTFAVNGKKIFASGVNWVPPELLPGEITDDRYRRLLAQAREAGFTMLRVWGGGLIERDTFYDECDRLGLLVWQEFPLACANYPGDEAFLQAKQTEAEAVVRRLRQHPCIALWCGGNEVQYYGMSVDHPLLERFEKVVNELHPQVAYHRSSPDLSREGERHHGPWRYQTHATWNEHFRHFNSEYGCNAPVSLDSLRRFIPEDELAPDSPSMRHHFTELSHCGGVNQFGAQSLADQLFYGQFIQADGLAYVMGLYRARQYRSSGCLIWQFNSAWPEGSWSIVDYYGKPKIALHWLRDMARPQVLTIKDEGWQSDPAEDLAFELYAVNGSAEPMAGRLVIEVWHQGGTRLHREQHRAELGPDEVADAWTVRVPANEAPAGVLLIRAVLHKPDGEMIRCDRLHARGEWADAVDAMAPVRLELARDDAEIVQVTNVGNTVALATELRPEPCGIGDNFFHLVPGERRRISASAPADLLNIFAWNRPVLAPEMKANAGFPAAQPVAIQSRGR